MLTNHINAHSFQWANTEYKITSHKIDYKVKFILNKIRLAFIVNLF